MSKRILDLEKQLKLETERNTKLEQYTRRENLRFNNIKEMEKEDCKAVIYDILQRNLELDTSVIRFHAVHRVGKRMQGRTRPGRRKEWAVKRRLGSCAMCDAERDWVESARL